MEDIAEKDLEKLRRNLEELNCPLTKDCNNSWIKELLLKPGDLRMKLFSWILESISSSSRMFAKFQQITDSDAKARYLSKAFSDIGYGNHDNMKIIQGTAPKKVQAEFFLRLLNAICCLKQNTEGFAISAFPLPDVTLTQPSSACNTSEGPKMSSFQYSAYIENTAASYISSNSLENAMPLDIGKILKEKAKKISKTHGSRQTMDRLLYNIEAVASELKKLETEIERYPAMVYPSETTCENLIDIANKVFRTSSAYRGVHANEIMSNCKVRKTALSELGPICSSTRESLQYIYNINNNISLFKKINGDIKQHKQWLKMLMAIHGSPENPDSWIREYRVFNSESIKILKPSVNSSSAQFSLMDTFCNAPTLT